jgi:hypothetical protein
MRAALESWKRVQGGFPARDGKFAHGHGIANSIAVQKIFPDDGE